MTSLHLFNIISGRSSGSTAAAKPVAMPPTVEQLDAIDLPEYISTDHSQSPIQSHPPKPRQPSDLDNTIQNATLRTKTPNELEQSQPPTPTSTHPTNLIPSWHYPKRNKWRHLTACLEYFGNGLNDSSPGALLPYIEASYKVDYAIVSLIWIANAFGFILAAFSLDYLDGKLGRAKTLMLAEATTIAAYVVLACPVPFPVIVVAFFVLGIGLALTVALNNVFCSNLANSTVMLGTAHGCYGIGGVVGPILATALVSSGINWHRFYIIVVGLRAVCLVCAGWSFRGYESEETTQFSNSLVEVASRQDNGEQPSKLRGIAKALKNRTTLVGALFIFAYQGVEVSESGWFISYLIAYRNADPAHVGFVTSGFWGGITLGRFVLTYPARRIGEKRYVLGLGIGVIVFQILAWFIPNIIGDSISVSILGLLLGPVYPCGQTVFTQLLPRNIQVFAIGFISSAGSSGGAVVPFLTGLLAQAAGTYVLHPVCIGFTVLMLVCWMSLPRVVKKAE